MMAINLQTSFLNPPFGFALFYLRGVAPDSVKTSDIYKGVIPFILIQMIMLILLSVHSQGLQHGYHHIYLIKSFLESL